MNWTEKFQRASRHLSLFILGIGVIVLLGWIFNITLFKRIFPTLVEMKANTALGFVLSGLALFFLQSNLQSRRKNLARGFALGALLIGLLTLSQYIFGWNLGIDQLLFVDEVTRPGAFPGRMATPTALCFLLIGIALLLYTRPFKQPYFQIVALIVGIISLLAILGYIYDVSSLYTLYQNNPMALHTAIGFFVLSLGILFLNPTLGLMRPVIDPGSGGTLIRRLIPVAMLVPVIFGWLILQLEYAGIHDVAISFALITILTVIIFSGIIWASAYQVYHKETAQGRSQKQFRTLLDESLDVILVASGAEGNIVNVNNSVRRILGYDPQKLIGQPVSVLFPPEADVPQAEIAQKLRTAGHVFLSQEFLRADGSICPMDLTAAVVPWGDDRAVLVTLRDVTERNLLEAEILRSERLRVEMEKDRELVEFKERFITMVSHDFRTPLAVIMTSNDMLERYYERLTQGRRVEQMQKIREQVYFMTDMLDEVLTLSKAKAQKLDFHPTPINLTELCQTIVDEASATDAGAHTFRYECGGTFGDVHLDSMLIHRVLANLLSNAVKYSPDGGEICLKLTREENIAVMRVTDHGIGIPEKDQARLFEPFHRAGNTNGIKGTGLGLAIVNESIRLHNGSIDVDSTEGVGTTVTVRLPV